MSEFDNTNQFVEGADPTAQAGPFASLLLQMMRLMTPATLYGVVIESSDTPPTSGDNAWRKRCLWFKNDYVRTDGGVGAYFRWDETAGSWENLEDYLNGYGAVPDESVNLSKLDPSIGAALQLIRKNAGNTAWEFVSPADIIANGSLSVAKLAPRTSEPKTGYFLLTDSNGAYTETSFSSALQSALFLISLFTSQLTDDLGGLQNQVLYKGSADNFLIGYVETLLRPNQTPTSRLALPGADLYLKVNGSNSDIVGVSQATLTAAVAPKVAVLRAEATAGTNGQSISGGATGTVALTQETDPDSIVSLAAGVFTLAETGKYLIQISVPIDAEFAEIQLQLYSEDGASVVAHRTMTLDTNGDGCQYVTLDAVVTVTGTSDDAFSVKVVSGTGALVLGKKVNIGGLAEVYSMVTITKYAS